MISRAGARPCSRSPSLLCSPPPHHHAPSPSLYVGGGVGATLSCCTTALHSPLVRRLRQVHPPSPEEARADADAHLRRRPRVLAEHRLVAARCTVCGRVVCVCGGGSCAVCVVFSVFCRWNDGVARPIRRDRAARVVYRLVRPVCALGLRAHETTPGPRNAMQLTATTTSSSVIHHPSS